MASRLPLPKCGLPGGTLSRLGGGPRILREQHRSRLPFCRLRLSPRFRHRAGGGERLCGFCRDGGARTLGAPGRTAGTPSPGSPRATTTNRDVPPCRADPRRLAQNTTIAPWSSWSSSKADSDRGAGTGRSSRTEAAPVTSSWTACRRGSSAPMAPMRPENLYYLDSQRSSRPGGVSGFGLDRV